MSRNLVALCMTSWFLLQGAVPVWADELADPTRPLQYSAPAQGTEGEGIKLTSILIASDRKLAIINGQTLRELQTIQGVGAVVKKIEADAVVLQQGDKIWRVALNHTAIRK